MRYCKDCGAPMVGHGPVAPFARQKYRGRAWPSDTTRECPTKLVRSDFDRLGNEIPVARLDRALFAFYRGDR